MRNNTLNINIMDKAIGKKRTIKFISYDKSKFKREVK